MRLLLIFTMLVQLAFAMEARKSGSCDSVVERIHKDVDMNSPIAREVVRKCSGFRDIAKQSNSLSGQYTVAASLGSFISSGATYWAVNDDKEKNYEWWANGVSSIAMQMIFTIFNAKYVYGTLRASTIYGQSLFNYGVVSAQEVVSSSIYHAALMKKKKNGEELTEVEFRAKLEEDLQALQDDPEAFKRLVEEEFGPDANELNIMNKVFLAIDEGIRMKTVGNTQDHLIDTKYDALNRGTYNIFYNLAAVPITTYISFEILRHICSSANPSIAVAQATAFYLVYRLAMDTTYYALRRPIADQ